MRCVKKFLLLVLSVALLVVFVAGFGLFYAFRIEPFRLKVNECRINKDGYMEEDLKVIQFSDLHIKEDFPAEKMEKAVDRINSLSPDIVIFTGDLYDNYAVYHEDDAVIAKLSSISAKYGKIAVWGNRDYGGGASRQYPYIMEQAGFKLLRNESSCIVTDTGKKILISALDDSMLGDPFLPENSCKDENYSILLSHEPDRAADYLDSGYDLVLSGHSHGGQINIPFLPMLNKKALSVTDLASDYSGGMYEPDTPDGTKLYVNTGIGTTHISARFGVVPEITLFHIYL